MIIVHLESGRNFGGQELRTINEVKSLSKRGHQVSLITKPGTPTFLKAKKENLNVESIPFKNALDLFSIFWLVRYINQHKVDVLHAHSAKDAWVAGIAARLAFHRPAFIRTRHVNTPVKHRYAYTKLPDSLHVLTHARRGHFISAYGVPEEKIHVFYPTVDLKKYQNLPDKQAVRTYLNIQQDAWVWLNIAQFRGEKDHHSLLEAFAHCAKERPNAVLVLAGGDKNGKMYELEKHAKQLGIIDKVHFLGFVDDIHNLYPAADLFVLSSSVEPFGKVIIEAFAAGIPVVSTRTEGALEIIGREERGLLADIKSPDSIAEKCLILLHKPSKAEQFKSQAHQWVQSLDFEAGISKLITHYQVTAKRTHRKPLKWKLS